MAAQQPRGNSPDLDAHKKARLASLLATYYQAEGEDAGTGRLDDASGSTAGQQRHGAAAGGGSRLPPRPAGNQQADIDSAYFNANAFLSRALRDSRLDELVDKHKALTSEIGGLDGDMQLLVYENYSKFISATDTIKAMKTNVESMDSRMQELQELITSVSGLNSDVDGVLCERRSKIEQLNQVRTLLAKLQAVFDLPKKMRSALDVGALHVAVAQHAQVAPVLRAYGHKGSFRKVAAEAAALARETAAQLRRRMAEDPDEAGECLQLMQRLGEPTEHLQDTFLDGVQARLGRMLAAAGAVLKARAAAAGLLPGVDHVELPPEAELFTAPAPSPAAASKSQQQEGGGEQQQEQHGEDAPERDDSLREFLRRLDALFLAELARTEAVFSEVFAGQEPRRKLVAVARTVFARYVKLVRRAFADLAAVRAAAAAGITPSGQLLGPAADSGSATGVGAAAAAVAAAGDDAMDTGAAAATGAGGGIGAHGLGQDWGTAEVVAALRVVAGDLPRLQSALPELSPQDRASEVLENVVRYHMTTCFSALEQRAAAALQAAHARALRCGGGGGRGPCPAPLLGELAEEGAGLQALLLAGLDAIVAQMKAYEREAWLLAPWRDVFADAVQGQLQQVMLALLSRLVAMAAVHVDQFPLPGSAAAAAHHQQQQAAAAAGGPAGAPESPGPGAGAPFDADGDNDDGTLSAAAAGPLPPPTGLLLLLAVLARFLERSLLPHVMSVVVEQFGGGGGAYDDRPPAFVAAEVARSVSSAARQLLGGYAAQHARGMGLALRRGMDAVDWLHAREPRQPRAVCDLVLAHAQGLRRELAALLPGAAADGGNAGGGSGVAAAAMAAAGAGRAAGGGQHRRVPSGLSQASSGGGGFIAAGGGGGGGDAAAQQLERGISRAFKGAGKFDAALLEFDEHSLITAVVCSALQSFAEAVRLQTVGRAGLQQLQVDARYLRRPLLALVGDGYAAAADAVLGDVVRAATERATDPTPLDAAVLDRILGVDHARSPGHARGGGGGTRPAAAAAGGGGRGAAAAAGAGGGGGMQRGRPPPSPAL